MILRPLTYLFFLLAIALAFTGCESEVCGKLIPCGTACPCR